MRQAFDERLINECVYYIPNQNLIYFNNPKVACSTVKSNLWRASDRALGVKTYRGNPHMRDISPFARDIFSLDAESGSRLRHATTFSVVRNPFIRILSAYLDKVGEDRVVWQAIIKRFGLKNSVTKRELSFRDFLVMINSEPDELLDTHFRPQYINLLWPLVTPDFLGRLENFDEVAEFLRRNNIKSDPYQAHATRARELIDEYYSDETFSLVRDKFADDFRIFGYSTDVSQIDKINALDVGAAGCGNLFEWIETREYPYEYADEDYRAFRRFSEKEIRSRDERTEIIRQSYRTDGNWRRLQTYLIFSLQIEEYPMAREIFDRIYRLRTAHHDAVENKDIFLDRVA